MIYTTSHVIVELILNYGALSQWMHSFRGWGLDSLTSYFSAARLEWLHLLGTEYLFVFVQLICTTTNVTQNIAQDENGNMRNPIEYISLDRG